jgi:hypothetical protein
VSEVDEQIARSTELLNRTSERYRSLSQRRAERRRQTLASRLGRIAIADVAILLGAMVLGWFVPLGIGGAMLVMLLLLIATVGFAIFPAEPTITADKLDEAPLKYLPMKTEQWLERQRATLPAPAARMLDATDPAKAKAVRESALFYVRQRTQDLLTQMAVTVQGYLALDLVKKNNVELIKGVDRASTTTVSALRTAVTVAQALTSQKLVLEQITALNTTTANIIDSTGKLLKTQTAQIHEQAASSTIPLEVLSRAFQNVYDTMDSIDTFKVKALESMKTTVNALTNEVEKSRGYIARAEGAEQGQSSPLQALDAG